MGKVSSENIKLHVTPTEFYERELDLVLRANKQWVEGGLCPFHPDRHTGSFRVNLISGAFKCFSCGAHGSDIIAFVQARYTFSFRDALQYIADEWGISE